jgi:hypothetical protein
MKAAMSDKLLLWSPRILGILTCLFIGLFALDAFGPGKGLMQALLDFAVHLIPSLVLLVVVALSWRWPWVGGVVFTAGAAAYAYLAAGHPSWIAIISGPLLTVGVLFFWSWRHQRGVARLRHT